MSREKIIDAMAEWTWEREREAHPHRAPWSGVDEVTRADMLAEEAARLDAALAVRATTTCVTCKGTGLAQDDRDRAIEAEHGVRGVSQVCLPCSGSGVVDAGWAAILELVAAQDTFMGNRPRGGSRSLSPKESPMSDESDESWRRMARTWRSKAERAEAERDAALARLAEQETRANRLDWEVQDAAAECLRQATDARRLRARLAECEAEIARHHADFERWEAMAESGAGKAARLAEAEELLRRCVDADRRADDAAEVTD